MRKGLGLLAGLLLLGTAAAAQPSGQRPAAFEGVGVDEQLGTPVPPDLAFFDEAGRRVALGTYFQTGRPVLLNLAYHTCPMLCNVLLEGLTKTLRELDWTPGREFEVLTVSFNAIETPALARRQKDRYLAALGRPEAAAGWHFLTGDTASIGRLTRAVGYRYRWVAAQQEFAHPAALVFLSGEGKVSRYLYGLEVAPRDVRTPLVEASEGKVGSVLDRVMLYCFQYDPNANSYVASAQNIMKIGGLLTLLALGAVLLVFWRREGRRAGDAVAS
jgi:protein SCO1/2